MCDGDAFSLLILQAIWGNAGVFYALHTLPEFSTCEGENVQQGGLVVKEDHPLARSFPAQLHYVRPSEGVLA